MKPATLKRLFNKALKKDSIIAFEQLLEKLAKSGENYWFRYYYDFRNLNENQKWIWYYRIVVSRNDFKPKYRAKALDYLCKK